MDIEEIKTLTDLMVSNDLSEIMIRDGEKRIVIRRGGAPPAATSHAPIHAAVPMPQMIHHASASPPEMAPAADSGANNLPKITSPMVGTFYAAPDPDSPPFVKIGDRVSPETVVCIIEAMKVFNEIKAEISGTIESIEVSSGMPVEFGQVLMRVRT